MTDVYKFESDKSRQNKRCLFEIVAFIKNVRYHLLRAIVLRI